MVFLLVMGSQVERYHVARAVRQRQSSCGLASGKWLGGADLVYAFARAHPKPEQP
jgi:hypothetical protein